MESSLPLCHLFSTKWFYFEIFKIQIWLTSETREFSGLYSSCFLKTRIRAFFHMWPAQEGGIYCKCLSDAIQPPLSKREFIQEALVTSSRKNATAVSVHRLNHMPRHKRWVGSANRQEINRWGREISASSEQSQQGYFQGWPLSRESLIDKLPSLFHKSTAGDFPSA